MPMSDSDATPLLKLRGLKKHFPLRRSSVFSRAVAHVKAVDGVDLDVRAGETLGLVGESGCGKSTLGRLMLRLIEPTSGEVSFDGQDLRALGRGAMKRLRRQMQMVFQDPYGSLNPRMTVRQTIEEAFLIHRIGSARERREAALALMNDVGLDAGLIDRYPHEFSGGQRQRIGIARALALKPRLIVCDEPVSALDMSIQAQVLNLLKDLQERFGLTYVFISHDLRAVRFLSDRVAVMYLGRIIEVAPADDIYARPVHPYTEALIKAIPQPNADAKRADDVIEGDVPSPVNPPTGCHFHPRCPLAIDVCRSAMPELRAIGPGRSVACHLRA
jgi:oligopeptide/dipeptide ABC transporter ATP-binding protein